MSMIGNYLRVRPAAVTGLISNPDGIEALLYPDGDFEAPEDHLDIDKSWHAIHFLLNGDQWDGEPPLVDAVMGGEVIGEIDVGYGPARLLTPQEVAATASAISDISSAELLQRFNVETLNAEEIYPEGWSGDEGEREYIASYYQLLVKFFRAASEAGDAMILYLN